MITGWIYAVVLSCRPTAVIWCSGLPQIYQRRKDAEFIRKHFNRKNRGYCRVQKWPVVTRTYSSKGA